MDSVAGRKSPYQRAESGAHEASPTQHESGSLSPRRRLRGSPRLAASALERKSGSVSEGIQARAPDDGGPRGNAAPGESTRRQAPGRNPPAVLALRQGRGIPAP